MVLKSYDKVITFKYGILKFVVMKSVVSSHFLEKYFYFSWWVHSS
uniref:Uncharacterized protein n=1 Tax=Rhizophora mucronata TaxID=61149 RepID=A0A2P2J0N0_RHIMU